MQPTSAAEKELLKENLYRNRFKEILSKNRGLLIGGSLPAADNDDSHLHLVKEKYAAEKAIIDRVVSNERSSILNGIGLGVIVFASVRFGPRYLVTRIGGAEKVRAFQEADNASKGSKHHWIKIGVGLFFESTFGIWAGYRGYNMLSSQTKDSYEEIAKIPLCAGRSAVSENVCPEWVNLVHREISPAFWDNLDTDGDAPYGEIKQLKDVRTWRAIRNFADNCVKRQVFEESYRKRNGLQSGAPVVVPDTGVPVDILSSVCESK